MKREPLNTHNNPQLTLEDYDGNRIEFVIKDPPLGEGGSCIVYEAEQVSGPLTRDGNDKSCRTHIVKECYPEMLRYYIKREADGKLKPDALHEKLFENHKSGFFQSFIQQSLLHERNARSSGSTRYTENLYLGNGTYYTVTEIPVGIPLDKASGCIRTLYDAVSIICQLAAAVRDYHEYEMLHLDVKPANVFWHTNIDAGNPYHISLLDFDSSRNFDEILSGDAESHFTAWYAPEQSRNQMKKLSFATDIYAIGAVFYWLLTGNKYEVFSEGYFRRKPLSLHTRRQFLAHVDPRCHEAVEQILKNTLHIMPAMRYQEIKGEFEDNLERLREFSNANDSENFVYI